MCVLVDPTDPMVNLKKRCTKDVKESFLIQNSTLIPEKKIKIKILFQILLEFSLNERNPF
jgi:hypothetical protein